MNRSPNRVDWLELRAFPIHDVIHAHSFYRSMVGPEKVKALTKLDRLHTMALISWQNASQLLAIVRPISVHHKHRLARLMIIIVCKENVAKLVCLFLFHYLI